MSVSQLHSWWLFLSQLGENLFFQLWPTSNIKSHFATTWKNNDISKTLWNFWIISFLISSEWCLQILYNLPPGCQKKFLTKSSILGYWDRKCDFIYFNAVHFYLARLPVLVNLIQRLDQDAISVTDQNISSRSQLFSLKIHSLWCKINFSNI